MRLLTKPRGFQIRGARKIEKFKGLAILADEMGLGKTLTSFLYAYWHQDTIQRILIVCPAGLKWNWERELLMHFNQRVEILSGRSPYPLTRRRRMVVVVNYDILQQWLQELRSLRFDFIIGDEAHLIKNRRAQRTKAFKKLSRRIKKRLLLSGTPITARASELWTLLNVIRPKKYNSFFSYAFRFCVPKKRFGVWDFSGSSNLEELHEELKETCLIRRTKSQVMKELPKKSRFIVPLEISHRGEYDKAFDKYLQTVKRVWKPGQRAIGNELMVQSGRIKRLVAELKMTAALEWVQNFLDETEDKIILFAVHKKIIRQVCERFKKLHVMVDGSIIGKDRQAAYDTFTRDPSKRVFIGNIQAAGMGWNGIVASTVAFLELDWLPGLHIQAEDRVNRMGQKSPTNAFYLVARDTIELKLCKILQDRQQDLNAVLDGRKVMKDSLNIHDLFLREITKGVK